MSAAIKTGPLPDVPEAAETSERTELATRSAGAMQHAAETPARVMSPIELIQYAIDKQLPAEQLEKLAALHERMEDRNAAREFTIAMEAFQDECPPIRKNKTAKIATDKGSGFSYSYAERDEMEAHIKPYRVKHGLSHTFSMIVDEKGAMLTSVCTVSHRLGHSRESRFTVPTMSNSGASPQQKFGAADSYASRRALASAYGLSITDKEVPDSEVDPTTINDDQATEIEDLLHESGAGRAKFLGYFDAETVADIRAANYGPAVAMLRDIAKRKGRAQ